MVNPVRSSVWQMLFTATSVSRPIILTLSEQNTSIALTQGTTAWASLESEKPALTAEQLEKQVLWDLAAQQKKAVTLVTDLRCRHVIRSSVYRTFRRKSPSNQVTQGGTAAVDEILQHMP